MASHPASPADVLDEAPFAKVLQSAKRRVIAALDLAVLDACVAAVEQGS